MGTPSGRVLVTGAGGKTGRAVVRALAGRGARVTALVRSEEHHVDDADEHVVADQRERSALERALEGMDAVVAIAPNLSGADRDMAEALVAACRTAGVGRLVLHSVVHPQLTAMPHHTDKARAEEVVVDSGLDWTVLQPNAYLQNLASYVPALQEGRFPVPYDPGVGSAMVDLDDVAEVAARAALEGLARHGTLELSGPDEVTGHDVAELAGRLLGRTVVAERVDPGAFVAASGIADAGARERLLAMLRHYDRHGSPGDATVLASVLGRPPGSLGTVLGPLLVG